MGKGLDTGKSFFQGILGKITDPEQKAAAEKLMANESVLTLIGNGVEGQAEIDRQLQTLKTQKEELEGRTTELDQRETGLTDWHGRLAKWHKENADALAAAKATATGAPATPPATETKVTGLTKEQLDEQMVGERAAFLGFQRDQNEITREHFTKFKEIPDLEPLLTHPQIAQIGLKGVYALVHKDRLTQFDTDAATARENAIRADERQKVREASATMPYPSPTGSGSGSPLDALVTGQKEPVVDAAVSHYNRLVAERDGAAAR